MNDYSFSVEMNSTWVCFEFKERSGASDFNFLEIESAIDAFLLSVWLLILGNYETYELSLRC